MKNNEKIKNISNHKYPIFHDNNSYPNLNNSFQAGNCKLKLKYSFLEKTNFYNFKNSIISKLAQIQTKQQKTNLKLSSLITILLSKLIGIKKYTISSSNFSILKPNIIPKKIEQNLNAEITNKDKKEIIEQKNNNLNLNNNNTNKNNTIRKIGTISLETELEIRRYTLSNQKTKSKEKFFKPKDKKEKEKDDINLNKFYNNLFRIDNNDNNNNKKEEENKKNDYYYSSLNKNSSTQNMKKNLNKNNNRKPLSFNEINQNNGNKNYFSDNINKIIFSENSENRRVYINALNIHSNSSHNINKDKDINNKSNISDDKSTKGPVKIKINQNEKPVLLINFNENNNKSKTSNNLRNIINLSNNSNEKNTINNENKNLSLQIEDSSNNHIKNQTLDDDIKIRRKYSESRSEAEINLSNFSNNQIKNPYSRKIRGFNFRNNIKYNKNTNSEDEYINIKGGSVRYNNNENLLSQINS